MNNARTHLAAQGGVPNPAWGDGSSDRLGYDGSGRMIAKRYLNATAGSGGYSSTASLVGFTTVYDRSSNKLFERHLHAEGRSFLYPAHDSLNRLREYRRSGGGLVATPITVLPIVTEPAERDEVVFPIIAPGIFGSHIMNVDFSAATRGVSAVLAAIATCPLNGLGVLDAAGLGDGLVSHTVIDRPAVPGPGPHFLQQDRLSRTYLSPLPVDL